MENEKAKPACGNCQFSLEADARHVACFGMPPTPVVMGVRQSTLVGGGMQAQFENIRPILAKGERPCSLWRPREADAPADESGLTAQRTH